MAEQSTLVLLLVRLGFLALLWLFVFVALRTIRLDIFGPKVSRATRARTGGAPAARAAGAAPAKPRSPGRRAKHLVITQGALAGTTVQLGDGPITIGRSPQSSIVINDDYASNHHARLVPHEGTWVLEDLGSTNGTYLDRTKVTGAIQVGVGSKVRIGKTVLELRK